MRVNIVRQLCMYVCKFHGTSWDLNTKTKNEYTLEFSFLHQLYHNAAQRLRHQILGSCLQHFQFLRNWRTVWGAGKYESHSIYLCILVGVWATYVRRSQQGTISSHRDCLGYIYIYMKCDSFIRERNLWHWALGYTFLFLTFHIFLILNEFLISCEHVAKKRSDLFGRCRQMKAPRKRDSATPLLHKVFGEKA